MVRGTGSGLLIGLEVLPLSQWQLLWQTLVHAAEASSNSLQRKPKQHQPRTLVFFLGMSAFQDVSN